MAIDLHIHSTISDGTMTPGDIVSLAENMGLEAISITDHDTVDGIVEAQRAAVGKKIEVIPGIELSSQYQEYEFHILGYYINYHDETLQQNLVLLQKERNKRNKAIVEKLKSMGINISFNKLIELSGGGQCGRPHIARLLVNYGVTASVDEAFDKYLRKGKAAYCERFVYDVRKCIKLITDSGGIAVLAHPYALTRSGCFLPAMLSTLKRFGLGGVEIYYPNHTKKFRKQLINLAKRYELLATGGSDFHDKSRPGMSLANGENVSVPSSLLPPMRSYLGLPCEANN